MINQADMQLAHLNEERKKPELIGLTTDFNSSLLEKLIMPAVRFVDGFIVGTHLFLDLYGHYNYDNGLAEDNLRFLPEPSNPPADEKQPYEGLRVDEIFCLEHRGFPSYEIPKAIMSFPGLVARHAINLSGKCMGKYDKHMEKLFGLPDMEF